MFRVIDGDINVEIWADIEFGSKVDVESNSDSELGSDIDVEMTCIGTASHSDVNVTCMHA